MEVFRYSDKEIVTSLVGSHMVGFEHKKCLTKCILESILINEAVAKTKTYQLDR